MESELLSHAAAPPVAPVPMDAPRPARQTPARKVLLVGAAAAGLRGRLDPAIQVETASSLLEAVLLLTPAVRYDAIFAAATAEQEELLRAVESIQQAAQGAPLYLLCEAMDEPMCRQAKRHGAADYLVEPVSKEMLAELLDPGVAALRAQMRRAAPAHKLRAPVQITVAQLPLVVDTVLLNHLLEGRGDFVQRAVATLQGYMSWPGTLRFDPQEVKADHPQVLRATVAHGNTTFGTLLLELPEGVSGEASTLGQAATWLAGWMAMAHRNEQLRVLAITDELSGAYNRRYFRRFTQDLLARAAVERFRVSVLLFDIDDFKKYNDLYGHAAGDAIIREMIRLLRTCTRPHDLVARLGGDEFAVVFWDNEPPRQPGSQHPKDAVAATERFRKVLASHDWKQGAKVQGEVSISGGLATYPWDGEKYDDLMAKADAALLRAKRAGKNAIVLHSVA